MQFPLKVLALTIATTLFSSSVVWAEDTSAEAAESATPNAGLQNKEDVVQTEQLEEADEQRSRFQENAQGFLEGSTISVLGRSMYMNRDFKNGAANDNINTPVVDGSDYLEGDVQNFTSDSYLRLKDASKAELIQAKKEFGDLVKVYRGAQANGLVPTLNEVEALIAENDKLIGDLLRAKKKKPKGYAEEWGASARAFYESGYTQGLVGFGVNIYAGMAQKLDTGRGREGVGMFPSHQPGRQSSNQYGMIRGAAKARYSATSVTAGTLLPQLPVVSYDDARLLPQTFRGGMLTSHDVENLEFNLGRFTAFNPMNQSSYTAAPLKALNVVGGKYSLTENLSSALYYADTKDIYKKKYANLNYLIPIEDDQDLALDFNIYRTNYKSNFTGVSGQANTIWGFAPTYSYGPHAFTVAYQQNTGDRGYEYDYGDGGGTIFLPNSYYSDFNHKNEKSWQGAYELDFGTFGLNGLTFKTAYVKSGNVDRKYYDESSSGHGRAHEWYNQVSYSVPEGFAKDLYLKLRSSTYRSNYDTDVNDIRAIVEYPLDLL